MADRAGSRVVLGVDHSIGARLRERHAMAMRDEPRSCSEPAVRLRPESDRPPGPGEVTDTGEGAAVERVADDECRAAPTVDRDGVPPGEVARRAANRR